MLYTGVDIGTSAIKFVRLKKVKNTYIVVDYFYQDLPFTSQTAEEGKSDLKFTIIVEELKKLNQKFHLNKDFLITAISRHTAIIKTIFLPSSDPNEIKNMVSFEMEKQIPFPLDKGITDYIIVNNNHQDKEESSQTEVCLVATKNETMNRHLLTLKAAGLEPNMVSITSLAVVKSLTGDWRNKKKENSVYAVVDIGNQFSDVNLVQKGELISGRSINLAGMYLTSSIQAKFGIDYLEAENLKRRINTERLEPEQIKGLKNINEEWLRDFSEEIKACLNLFKKERPGLEINDILLTGGGSKLNGLKDYLANTLKMNVEYGNPLIGIEGVTISPEDIPIFSVAIGLGLCSNPQVSSVNLIPREIQEKKKRKIKRQKFMVYGSTLLAIVVLVLGVSFQNIAKTQIELNKINQQIKTLQPLIQETKIMKEQMDKLRESITGSVSSLEVLREISVLCPPNVYLTNFSYEKGGFTEIKGRTVSHSDVSKFSTALDKSPYFGKVEIKRSETNNYGKMSLVDFEITCYPKDYSRK